MNAPATNDKSELDLQNSNKNVYVTKEKTTMEDRLR